MTDKKICLGRGRPRGFCVDKAVATALELFKERGYDGVGVAELAQAMGIAPPSLYAAFGSKAGLYARALDLYQRREGSFLAEALASEGGPRDLVAAIFRGTTDALRGEPRGCLICRGEQGCTDQSAAEMTAGRRRAARRLIEEQLRARGAADPGLLADYALAGIQGLTGAARDGLGAERLRHIADALSAGAPC